MTSWSSAPRVLFFSIYLELVLIQDFQGFVYSFLLSVQAHLLCYVYLKGMSLSYGGRVARILLHDRYNHLTSTMVITFVSRRIASEWVGGFFQGLHACSLSIILIESLFESSTFRAYKF